MNTPEGAEAPSIVQYQYDNSGALAMVTDSESGITSTYYYDLIDRLCKYEEAGQDYSFILEYGFNEMNQVSYAFETINGNRRSIGITYDRDNRRTGDGSKPLKNRLFSLRISMIWRAWAILSAILSKSPTACRFSDRPPCSVP